MQATYSRINFYERTMTIQAATTEEHALLDKLTEAHPCLKGIPMKTHTSVDPNGMLVMEVTPDDPNQRPLLTSIYDKLNSQQTLIDDLQSKHSDLQSKHNDLKTYVRMMAKHNSAVVLTSMIDWYIMKDINLPDKLRAEVDSFGKLMEHITGKHLASRTNRLMSDTGLNLKDLELMNLHVRKNRNDICHNKPPEPAYVSLFLEFCPPDAMESLTKLFNLYVTCRHVD